MPGPQASNTSPTSSQASTDQSGGFWDKLISPFNDPAFGTVAAGTGAGSGGKFSIDTEQMQAELPKWEQLLGHLAQDYKDGQRMAMVVKPGGDKDAISPPYVDAANASGQAFLQHNRQMQDFVRSYIKKMQTALGLHVDTEQNNVNQLNRQQGD